MVRQQDTMENKTNPNVLRKKFKDLNKLVYKTSVECDQHESITPSTNKGKLTEESKMKFLEKVKQKLEKLKKQNNDQEDFYTKVKENFQSFEDKACFAKFLENQEEEIKELESDRIFIQKYQYKDSQSSEVIRFGINLKNYCVTEEINLYNENLEKHLDKNDAKSNISKDSKYKYFREKYMEVTKSESLVLKNAIRFLEESFNNIALFDVFIRGLAPNKDAQVGAINSNDLHTVALYKTEDGEMLVIDPSNPLFSCHLSKFKDRAYTVDVLCDNNNKYKVYTPAGITGQSEDRYRDCIDIAVKISFLLNNSGNRYKSIKDIMSSQEIKLITNNPRIDEYFETDKIPIRLKQTSNIIKIIECNVRLELYNEQLKANLKDNADKKLIMDLEHNEEYKKKIEGLDKAYQSYIIGI